MLELGGADPDEAERALDDGRALARFRTVVEAQGGDPHLVDHPEKLPKAPKIEPFLAPRAGYVSAIDTRMVGLAAAITSVVLFWE